MRTSGTGAPERPCGSSVGGGLGALLEDALERDVGLGHAGRDAGRDAGPVVDGEADVIAALVALHRRSRAPSRAGRTGRPKRRRALPSATSAMSATTAEAVASPPAPGPISVSSLTASASIVTAFVTPITWAMAEDARHHGRVDALLDAGPRCARRRRGA